MLLSLLIRMQRNAKSRSMLHAKLRSDPYPIDHVYTSRNPEIHRAKQRLFALMRQVNAEIDALPSDLRQHVPNTWTSKHRHQAPLSILRAFYEYYRSQYERVSIANSDPILRGYRNATKVMMVATARHYQKHLGKDLVWLKADAKHTTKLCPRCKETKINALFYHVPSRSNGLSGYCIPCTRDIARERHTADGARSRAPAYRNDGSVVRKRRTKAQMAALRGRVTTYE